jgi:hypothetical protein
MALEQVSSEYFAFPCPFTFRQILHIHLSSEAATIGELVVDVPSGLSLTPPHEKKINYFKYPDDMVAHRSVFVLFCFTTL